jgi:alpha-galactosidase
MPSDTIVEVNALVNAYGIQPIHAGPLPEPIAAHLRLHASVQQLTAQAALTGDRRLALQTFLLDPLVASVLEPGETEKMLDEMLRANSRYLPQFA